jgi:hypothetical protein
MAQNMNVGQIKIILETKFVLWLIPMNHNLFNFFSIFW